MKINLIDEVIAKEKIEVGDIVIFDDGSIYLMCYDTDCNDYRGVELNKTVVTPYYGSINALLVSIMEENDSEIVRFIKSENFELNEI